MRTAHPGHKTTRTPLMAFRRIHKHSLAGSPGYILGEYNVTNIPTILYNFLKVETVIVLKTGAEICKSFSVRE